MLTAPADSVVRLARSLPGSRGLSLTRLLEEAAAHRWAGVPVAYSDRPDGWVAANCLGLTGTGTTAAAALLDLDRRVRMVQVDFTLNTVADRAARPGLACD